MMGIGDKRVGDVREQFIRGDVLLKNIWRPHALDVPPVRHFSIFLTQLICKLPKSLPTYLQGSKAIFLPKSKIIFWLSPGKTSLMQIIQKYI